MRGSGKSAELKPPPVFEPQALIRWAVRGAQECASRCDETHDLSARRLGGGANNFSSRPLMPMERNRSPQGVTSHETPFCDSSFQRLFDGHGGLQSAAAKPGLDRNRRITTVRAKTPRSESHGPLKQVQNFLVNRVSIAFGNIVTFPGRRPSEDPSPAQLRERASGAAVASFLQPP